MTSHPNNLRQTLPKRQTQYTPSFAPPIPSAIPGFPTILARSGAKQPSSALKNRVSKRDAIQTQSLPPIPSYFYLLTSSVLLPPSAIPLGVHPVKKRADPRRAEKNPVPFAPPDPFTKTQQANRIHRAANAQRGAAAFHIPTAKKSFERPRNSRATPGVRCCSATCRQRHRWLGGRAIPNHSTLAFSESGVLRN
jgi:hypothetical protein